MNEERKQSRIGCFLRIIVGVPFVCLIVAGVFLFTHLIVIIYCFLCTATLTWGFIRIEKGGKKYIRVGCAGLAIYAFLVLTSILGQEVGPWEGRVVDIDTGKPLEGAVIIAVWETELYGVLDNTHGFYGAREAVTDKNGYFRMSLYYPFNFFPIISTIDLLQFSVFKPGYFFVERADPDTFSKESRKDIEIITIRPSNDYSFTYKLSANMIELPNLSKVKKEDREQYWVPSRPSDVPQAQMINFTKSLNNARATLGYEPYTLPGESE